jgi:hypothetical protein
LKKILFATVFTLFGYFLSAQATGKMFTYLDCLYSFLKGTSTDLTDNDIEGYIRDYHNDIYRQYRNNEFEWYDKLEQYRTELNSKMASQDLNMDYVIVTNIEFGDYNFTQSGFPVRISEGTFFPISDNNRRYLLQGALFLIDFYKYNFFAMERSNASAFIASRTNSGGMVNRQIRLMIYFKLANFTSREYINIQAETDKNYFPVAGNISRIEVYDNTIKISDLVMK